MGGIGLEFEWGRLREAIVGLVPADQFVVLQWAEYLRWLGPEWEALTKEHAGRRLIDIAPEMAKRMGQQVDGFAQTLTDGGVRVHRPERLAPPVSRYLAPNEEGGQLYPRDPVLIVGTKVIESAMRIPS